MAGRRLALIFALGGLVHAVGIARNPLPAQDGLKFLRVARDFHRQPWADVIRNSDQHPLYPALVAAAQPVVASVLGDGPDSWRVAGQGIAALASLLAIVPLAVIARSLFDERAAVLASLFWIALPGPSALGHDTLSDSTAMAAALGALALGIRGLQTGSVPATAGCGLVAGLGYWARPEVALVPVGVLATAALAWSRVLIRNWVSAEPGDAEASDRLGAISARGGLAARAAILGVGFLAMVGLYALMKGEVSEKLALRSAAGLAPSAESVRAVSSPSPWGLDAGRWDFAPKEEAGSEALGFGRATARVGEGLADHLSWPLVALAAFGLTRSPRGVPRLAVAVYGFTFFGVLARHAMTFGYLSDRHMLTLAALGLPFASGGILTLADLVRRRIGIGSRRVGRTRWAVALLIGVGGLIGACRGGHPSRWGHEAAGRWVAEHAEPGDAVLDTRGWAAFVSGVRSYDYWHVRQALTDSRLAFVVVGADELSATSRRAETLRALLTYAAEPAAAFPALEGDSGRDVWIYRYTPPGSWEGMGR